jgi:hypothetical protein
LKNTSKKLKYESITESDWWKKKKPLPKDHPFLFRENTGKKRKVLKGEQNE